MLEESKAVSRTSSLQECQADLGATFASVAGWTMAQFYTDAIAEHLAVRTAVGLVDLSHHGSIRIWGGEAAQFLNGLVTNNVKTLQVGAGMPAGFLTGHGKVKALCRILNLGKEYLVINEPQTHDAVFKYVFPFSYAGDFKAEDASEEYRVLSVQGPKSPLVMKEVCFEPVPSLEEHGSFDTLIAGHRVLVVRASRTGGIGFDLLVHNHALRDVWDFILLKGRFHSIVPFGLAALDSLRIEAGIPEYGTDVDETNMMLEVGLEDAVSFAKGCYTGQEAVAMATYRGHISKRLSGLVVAATVVPRKGDIIVKDGKEIGQVTSALRSPSLGSVICLAYVKYGFFEPGTSMEIQIESDVLPAIVVELPFYREGGPKEVKVKP
ncbi:MAG TPA: aminomethyltransferase family protein [Blastocatellia bacterium]|nr:aminomethyltransferase family protein [Blastocatellia bacterium]